MTLLNYHELTMNEARDSPARRKQFLVICTVMATFFCYSTITSGILVKVNIVEGTFPGGTFVYKSAKRDYAAAPSLVNQIGKDLGLGSNDEKVDKLYTIYLDHPGKVSDGGNQRFASGFLARTSSEDSKLKSKLMDMNKDIEPPTKSEVTELAVIDLWPRLRYKKQSLPRAKAAVVNFPYTNGFISALIHSFKVFPALRRHAEEKQRQAGVKAPAVTVITTCSISEQMCTHYSPLEKMDSFLLGQPRMEDYIKTLPKSGIVHDLKRKLGFGSSKQATDEL